MPDEAGRTAAFQASNSWEIDASTRHITTILQRYGAQSVALIDEIRTFKNTPSLF